MQGKVTQLDSLHEVVTKTEKINSKQQEMLQKLDSEQETEMNKSDKAKAMAKTFEKMNVKQIAPILQNLDDETVMLIYRATSNRFKKNILLAVDEKRAALITNSFIHRN